MIKLLLIISIVIIFILGLQTEITIYTLVNYTIGILSLIMALTFYFYREKIYLLIAVALFFYFFGKILSPPIFFIFASAFMAVITLFYIKSKLTFKNIIIYSAIISFILALFSIHNIKITYFILTLLFFLAFIVFLLKSQEKLLYSIAIILALQALACYALFIEKANIVYFYQILSFLIPLVILYSAKNTTSINIEHTESYLRLMVEFAPYPILVYEETGRILIVNQKCRKLSGYQNFTISSIQAWFNQVSFDFQCQYYLDKVIDQGEITIKTANGEQRIWHITTAPLGYNEKNKQLLIMMVQDITEHKDLADKTQKQAEKILIEMTGRSQAEFAWKETEKRYQSILDNTQSYIIFVKVVENNFIIQHVNQLVEKQEDISSNTIKGQVLLQAFPYLKPLHAYLEQVSHTYVPATVLDFQYKNKWFDGYIYAISLSEIVILLEDRTEQHVLQQQLNLTQAAIHHTQDALFFFHADGQLFYVNDAACKLLQYNLQSLLQMHLMDLYPDYNQTEWQNIWQALQKETLLQFETVILAQTGDLISVEVFINYAYYQDHEYGFAHVRDITERKQVQSQLQENELRYRLIFNNTQISIWEEDMSAIWHHMEDLKQRGVKNLREYFVQDPSEIYYFLSLLKVKNVNEKSLLLYGVKQEKALTGNILKVIPDTAYAQFQEIFCAIWDQRDYVRIESINQRLDGVKFPIIISLPIPKSEQEAHIVPVSIIDISDVKETQKRLIETRDQLQTILDNIPSFIIFKDINNNILQINKKVSEVFHVHLQDLPENYYPDYLPGYTYQDDLQIIQTGLPILNKTHQVKLGNKHFWLEINKLPVRNHIGEINGIIVIANDITQKRQDEEKIIEKEHILRIFVDYTPAAVAMFDNNMHYVLASKRWVEDYQLINKDIIGQSHYQVFPDIPEYWREIYNRCLNGLIESCEEDIFEHSNGKIDWLRWEIHPWYKNGQQGGIIMFSEVITERKEAQERIRDSEERFRAIANYTYDWENWLAPDGLPLWINPAVKTITGYTPDEMLNNAELLYEIIHEEDRWYIKHLFKKSLSQQLSGNDIPFRIYHKNGQIYWVSVSYVPIFASNGDYLGLRSSIRNITERKRMEKALQDERDKAQKYLDIVESMIIALDDKGYITLVNRKACEILGYSEEELVGKDWFKTCIPLYKQNINRHIFNKTISGDLKGVVYYESPVINRAHQERLIAWYISYLYDEKGHIIGVLRAGQDITERKHAEEQLRTSEERFRTIFENAMVGILQLDLKGYPYLINPAFEKMLNYGKDRLYNMHFSEFTHPDDMEDAIIAFEDLLEGKYEYYHGERRYLTHDKKPIWVKLHVSLIKDKEQQPDFAIAIIEDVTEQKLAALQLQAYQTQLEKLVEERTQDLQKTQESLLNAQRIARLGNWQWDIDSQNLAWSDEVYRIFGQDTESFILHYKNFVDCIHPEDRIKMIQAMENALVNKTACSIDHRIILPDKTEKIVHEEAEVIVDENNKPKALIGTVQDVTEHRKMLDNLSEKTKQLEQINKELEQFAYAVSHDLRSPLVSIMGFVGELGADVEDLQVIFEDKIFEETEQKKVDFLIHQNIPEALTFIEASTKKMDDLIKSILKLSRLGRRELLIEPIDSKKLVENNIAALGHLIKTKNVKVNIQNLPIINTDRHALEQIFGNLLSNAVKYMDDSRDGYIEITATTQNDKVFFYVKDNGRGVAQEDLVKIFQIFRRVGTQDTEGEGMGLSYVKALVRRLNGDIWCESELGVGSTFIFSIAQAEVINL